MSLKVILATDRQGAIGKGNDLLYEFSDDLRRFKELTSGSTVVMGRKTFESLPFKLPNRTNIVLSKNYKISDFPEDKRPDEVIDNIDTIIGLSQFEDVWVIGGESLYKELIPIADELHWTLIDDYCQDYDVSIPRIERMALDNYKSMVVELVMSVDKKTGADHQLQFRTFKK